ncbi:MAG TPA: molybdopterin cofactor-binding domain-containing protein, partial [Vineibacter sp.]|nr:molybdopterin cofactor-binding domain-containing protein [Vineibacter sp.]
MKRRNLLIGAAVVGGGLVVGYRAWTNSFAAHAAALVARPGESLIGGWVKIAADDTVTVYVPHIDMGQGTHTALAMMLAEELDADWSKVRTEQAPPDKAFANRFLAKGWIMQGLRVPSFLDGAVDTTFAEAARFLNLQLTGGSTAVRITGQVGMRIVGAAARQVLLEAAASRWGVTPRELSVAAGVITHVRTGRSLRYGEIAASAAGLDLPASPPLKQRKDYTLIGTSVPRLDIPAKVTGTQKYGIDVRLPDMRYAAVMSAPVHGGKLVDVDPAPALAVKGVEHVVPLEAAVAVIARGYWQASRGLAALQPRFTDGGNDTFTSARLDAQFQRALDGSEGTVRLKTGDPAQALKDVARDKLVTAAYRVPFLHHAAMEPVNATAQVKDGKLTVWAGDQAPLPARREIVRLSGLAADDVTFVPTPLGGSFGRRGGANGATGFYFAQVIALAKKIAPLPVQMIWSREEDFAQGTYRPQVATRLQAALGADGKPLAWSQAYIDGVPSRVESFHIPYAIAHQSFRAVDSRHHVRLGSWRSVNHTQHGFWTESFIDELAHAAGRDPFQYRRDLLPAGSRARVVLETAAAKANWGSPLPPGVGRGIALVESYGSIVAEVIEATLGSDGTPVVHRVVAAVDCGDVCHPDTATQQVEGAIVMGLSAAIA